MPSGIRGFGSWGLVMGLRLQSGGSGFFDKALGVMGLGLV